ncbi:MAG: gamma-glutamyl-gamma-aminobutyrate hydrolase family protein [Thaumarchaeota archaeon]|nr:gamma-glutamyl-gamma-aminobutyrate hydrolase family protein [Nitrososphaerota archaeon]MDE1839773.1 gamma-glutamyl-gamma-aminobutyrate hydrolase family protein [Nitrososphaerota archaeon]
MLLVVDNGSVYTSSLLDCMRDLGVPFESHVFSDVSSIDVTKYSSMILSGRRKNNPQMNVINSRLVRHSLDAGKPLLGICYGAEILALTLGGTIKKMTASRHGLYQVQTIKNNLLTSGKIDAFESHSYMISKLGPAFIRIASSDNCQFEVFQYGNKNIFGTQFHPEMSVDGRSLLKKFSSINGINNT